MKTAPLNWMHTREGAKWIREVTPFDPKTTKGAGISRDTRWTMDCFLTPQDYLDLTGTTREQLIRRDKGKLIREYADAMEDQMAAGAGAFPVPWLVVDWDERAITGHEGRHRAAAAWTLELPAIPVVLVLRPKAYDLEEYVRGKGVITAAEDKVLLVQQLESLGHADVEVQRYTKADPEVVMPIQFVNSQGHEMKQGYRRTFLLGESLG